MKFLIDWHTRNVFSHLSSNSRWESIAAFVILKYLSSFKLCNAPRSKLVNSNAKTISIKNFSLSLKKFDLVEKDEFSKLEQLNVTMTWGRMLNTQTSLNSFGLCDSSNKGHLPKGQKDGKSTLQNVSLPTIYIHFLPKIQVHVHCLMVIKKTQGKKMCKCFCRLILWRLFLL